MKQRSCDAHVMFINKLITSFSFCLPVCLSIYDMSIQYILEF